MAGSLLLTLGACATSSDPELVDTGIVEDNAAVDTGRNPTSDVDPTDDTGSPAMDGGTPSVDTAVPPVDTGTPGVDTGTPAVDTGVPPMDSGTAPVDTGTPPPVDAGFPGVDTGTPPPVDAGFPAVDTGTATGTCPGGRALCAGVCVDPQSDGLNCGTCGRGCSVGEVCAAGACAVALRNVVISELRPAAVPYVELFNGGNAAVDLLNYRVQWSTEMGGSGSVTLPSFTLAAGAFVTLRSGTATTSGSNSLPLGSDLAWTTNIAVRLLAPSGQGLDFVRTGVSTAAAPAGTTWVGDSAPNPTADTDQVLVRAVYSPDTDTAADWSLRSQSSPGSFCARPGRCGTACFDLDADRDNCGACGFHCTGSQTCRSGVCVGGVGRPWLSEYRLNGRPAVEIHNPSASPIALAGYRLQVAPVSGTTFNFFLPAHSLPPGGFLTVFAGAGTDDATSLYSGMTAGFGPDVAIGLFDETNTGIDFVRVGASTMGAPAGLSWFGATVPAPSSLADSSIKRDLGAFDTDSAADWTLSSPATPGYLCNPGLTVCGGRCVDRSVDRANCGGCGTLCGPQQTCIAGACRSIGGLVFSELATATQSFELFNGSAASVDLSGFILDWVADGGSATFTVPSGVTVASGAFVRFKPGAGTSTANDVAMGTGVAVNWSTYIAVSIRTAANVGVDFVKTGTSPTPPPSGTAWAGANATNPNRAATESLVRNLWGADTNSAADWSIAAAPTPLAYCPSPTASTVMCGASCTDTQSSATNCGACGNTCNTNATCTNGQCGLVRLYHGWASPIAGCLTTGYNATAATSVGGVYPYNAGDSTACRAWKLAATICNSQPVLYSDTTNWMCTSSGGFTDPLFGTYCSVPNQYSCSTCPGACNAGTCSRGPISLRNCAGTETAQP